jgi:hypothetical protein
MKELAAFDDVLTFLVAAIDDKYGPEIAAMNRRLATNPDDYPAKLKKAALISMHAEECESYVGNATLWAKRHILKDTWPAAT